MRPGLEIDEIANFAALCDAMLSDPAALDHILPQVLDVLGAARASRESAPFLDALMNTAQGEDDMVARISRALQGGVSPAVAVDYLKQAIKRRNEPTPALLDALIDALRHDGRPVEAVEVARQLRRMLPDDVTIQVIEAEAVRHAGDHEEAERLLRGALPNVAGNPWVPFWVAEYAARCEEWSEVYGLLRPLIPDFAYGAAFELFCRAAATVNPDEALVHLDRAGELGVPQDTVQDIARRAKQARTAQYAAFLESMPVDVDAASEDDGALVETMARKLGGLLHHKGDVLGSLSAVHKKRLARLYAMSRRGGSAEAQERIRTALFASAVGDVGDMLDIAADLRRAGLPADARDYLLQARYQAVHSRHVMGWHCAELLRRDGFLIEADQIVNELLSAHRGDFNALSQLAENACSAEQGLDEERYRMAALAVEPGCPHTRLRLAELASATGDESRVVALLNGFASLAEHPRAQLLLARASFAVGRYEEAVKLAGRVLAAWPGDEETRHFLNRVAALVVARKALQDPEVVERLDSASLLGHGRILLDHGMEALVAGALALRVGTAEPAILAMLADAAFAANDGALAWRSLERLLAVTAPGDQAAFARTLERAGDFAVRGMARAEAAVWYRRAAALAPSAHIDIKLADVENRNDDVRPGAIPGGAGDQIVPLSIASGDVIRGRLIGLAEAAREYADAHFQIPYEQIPFEFERERFSRFDQMHMEPLALHLGVFQNVLCGEIYTPILPEHRRIVFNTTYCNFAGAGVPVRVFGRNFEYTLEKPVEVIDDPVVIIGGSVEYNYYHWLLNWMPRIMIAEAVERLWPELGRFKYLVHPNVLSVPQFRESIDRLGIPHDRLLLADPGNKPLLLRRCAIPSFMVQHFYQPQALDFVRRRVGGIADARPIDPASGRRVFISRQNVKGPKRRVHNFDEILPVLRKHGFEIIEMEAMSLAEQIDMTSQASLVCAMSGAALANLVFASPGSKLLLLSPDYLYEAATYRYWSGLARLLNFGMEFFMIHRFFDGQREWQSGDRPFHYIGDMNLDAIIDPQALDAWLAQQTGVSTE